MIPVVLSGGSGTRLWPVSRSKWPKQFCDLFEESLQNLTLKRVSPFGEPWVITSQALKGLSERKSADSGLKIGPVLYEPIGKNTAPAIAMLCKVLELQNRASEVVGIFPADQLIENDVEFQSALDLAIACAKEKRVVTLGIKPLEPATGYGYIQVQKIPFSYKKHLSSHAVLKFHEKPSFELAKEFLAHGSYYWNAGIFVFPVQLMIDLFQKYQPQIWNTLANLKVDLSNIAEIYAEMPSISIDYAIMEKLTGEELICVPCDPVWSDVGSWDAVAEVYNQTGREKAETVEVNSKDNFVFPLRKKKYSFVGVEDLIVVDTEDALLIVKKGESQDVKTVVDRLKEDHSKLVSDHQYEERPWGRFEVLRDEEHFKSKVIVVNPGQQISYQSHDKREEHWMVVKGAGEVVLNEKVIPVQKGTYIHIPLHAKHRIRNPGKGPLEFIEVQLGSYFGEDDIIRYQDDYKRS